MKLTAFPLILLLLIFSSCKNEETTEKQAPINPNGDSELALLMRQMYEDGMLAKQEILEDKALTTILKHEEILTAEATEPDKVDTDLYRTFANGYLELMAEVNDENNPNRKEAYSNLVDACLQCHKSVCPGPMMKINKLLIK